MTILLLSLTLKSIRRHFVGSDFDESQSTISNMLSFIEPIPHLDGPYQEIAGDYKGKVAQRGRLKGAADDGGVVDTRYRGGDIQFWVGFVEKLYRDSGKGSGSGILQHVKEREIERDLPLAENPWFSRHWWLTGGGRSRDGVP